MDNEDHHRNYAHLLTVEFVEAPLHMPELVQLDDPASYVLTDFTHNLPTMINADVCIDDALKQMKKQGERLLLVVDNSAADRMTKKRSATVIGQITACEILGDIPLKMVQSSGIKHNEITVKMLMTAQEQTQVVEWSQVQTAKVGHIVATMHHRENCHLLVAEDGMIRGIFSMSEISRHLDHAEYEPLMCAHSLAELVHTIG